MNFLRKFACLLALVGVACEADEPEQSGNLNRPAGLAVVTRGSGGVDLFIADSEAEGVRLQQFRTTFTGTSTIVDDEFALAPVVFFPLVIPAPGFPTELAFSKSSQSLYALAPAYVSEGPVDRLTGALHIIDATDPENTQLPLRASDVSGLVNRTTVDLEMVVGADLVPVDVETVLEGETEDRLLIVFESLTAQRGRAVLMGVQSVSGQPQLLAEMDLPPAPRQITRAEGDRYLIASAGSSTVTELLVNAEASSFDSVRGIDVGGPTRGLVSVVTSSVATSSGAVALALRVDRASVVLLELQNQGYERSQRRFSSPFTPVEERDAAQSMADQLGRIDLRSAVNSGAATISKIKIYDPSNFDAVMAQPGPLVFLAHVDGFATLLGNSPLEILVPEPSLVSRVTALTTSGASAANIDVDACRQQPLLACNLLETQLDTSPCDASIVRNELPEDATYRAEFFGLLHQAQNAVLSVKSATVAGQTEFGLRDGNVADFRELGVEPGDRLVVSLVLPETCLADDNAVFDRIEEGVVTEVQGAEVRAVFFTDPTDPAVPSSVLAALDCEDEDSPADPFPVLDVARYQLAVGDTDAVLTRRSNETVVEIVERVSSSVVGATRQAQFGSRFAFTLEAPADATCELGQQRCFNSADCGPGRTCLAGSDGCLSTCAAECVPGVAGCVEADRGINCPGVELEVAGTRLGSLDMGSSAFRATQNPDQTEVLVAVPSHSATLPWFDDRPVFVTSYPGSRTLIQLRLNETTDTATVPVVVRGSYVVDVTR